MSKIIKNIVTYSTANLITGFGTFILLPIYTNNMSVGDFGITSSMQAFSGILIVFMTLGLQHSIFRIYQDYDNENEKKEFLGTIIISVASITVFSIFITFIFNTFIQCMYPTIPFYPYYTLTVLYTSIIVLVSLFMTIKQLKHEALKYTVISLSVFFITATTTLILIVYYNFGATGFLTAMLFGAICTLLIALFISRKDFKLTFKFEYLKSALIYSLPLLPGVFSAWIINMSDRVFILNYNDKEAVGIYALGFRLANIAPVLSTALMTAYTPVFFELANKISIGENKRYLEKYNVFIISIFATLIFSIFLFSPEIIRWFFNPEYTKSIVIIQMLSFSFFFGGISGLFNLMVYQQKRTWQAMFSGVVSALINLLLNWIFIPKYGINAAAINSIIASITNFVMMYFYAKSGFYISIGINRVILMAASMAVMIILNLSYIGFVNVFSFYIRISFWAVIILLFLAKSKNDISIFIQKGFRT
jgi:O-antigen/teichoic acid export membrane protein